MSIMSFMRMARFVTIVRLTDQNRSKKCIYFLVKTTKVRGNIYDIKNYCDHY